MPTSLCGDSCSTINFPALSVYVSQLSLLWKWLTGLGPSHQSQCSVPESETWKKTSYFAQEKKRKPEDFEPEGLILRSKHCLEYLVAMEIVYQSRSIFLKSCDKKVLFIILKIRKLRICK